MVTKQTITLSGKERELLKKILEYYEDSSTILISDVLILAGKETGMTYKEREDLLGKL